MRRLCHPQVAAVAHVLAHAPKLEVSEDRSHVRALQQPARYVYILTHIHIYIYVYICVCIRTCIHLHVYVLAHAPELEDSSDRSHVRTLQQPAILIYTCIYIYIYIYIDVSMHVYICK